MKKIFTLLLFAMTANCLAQPTMTAANDATIGDHFVFVFIDSTGVTEGPSGASQTWDFSNVTPSGLQRTEDWVDPTTTPFQLSYPGSNIAQVTNDTAGSVYSYHTQSSSQTELNGIVSSILGSPADMHYSNSHIVRSYPSTFNTTYADTYEGMAVVTVGPITATTYRTGDYQYLMDAYGTLITPAGTFPNALRMKVNQVYTDSTVFSGVPLPAQIIQGFSTSYFFGSCDAGHKLYHFYIGYDTTITTITTVIKSVSYQDISTGINENTPFENKAYVYPVPANDMVTIRVETPEAGDAQLELFNESGMLVKSYQVKLEKKDYFEWQFQLTDLPSGLYSVRVSAKNQQWVSRIMKI